MECININGSIYKVVEKTEKEMYRVMKDKDPEKFHPFGLTRHYTREIFLNKDLPEEEFERTFRHELMHTWMWLTANAYQEEYNEEHICEMVAASNSIIHEIVSEYMNKRGRK